MANPEQIYQELRDYLVNEEKHLDREGRFVALKAIVDKHFAMDKTNHMISHSDLKRFVDDGKMAYSKESFPIKISSEEVSSNNLSYMFVLDSFIGYLNRHRLLKRIVRFDSYK